MSGFIKLHRKVADSEAFADEGVAFTWMMLLIRCQWKRTTSNGTTLRPGQILFTWRTLPERLQGAMLAPASVNTVRDRMTKLENCGAISIETFSRFSIATVRNWAKYQGDTVSKTDTVTVSKTDTVEPTVSKTDTVVDTVVDTVTDTVVDTVESIHPAKTLDENASKKEKKEKKIKPPKSPKGDRVVFDPLEVEIPSSLDCPAFRAAWGEWCQHRVERKVKLTPLAAKKQIEQLADWGHRKAIAAIEHSIRSGWQGIFEPNDKSTTANSRQPELKTIPAPRRGR